LLVDSELECGKNDFAEIFKNLARCRFENNFVEQFELSIKLF